MDEGKEILKPHPKTIWDDRVNSAAGILADKAGKRPPAGGRAQMGIVTFQSFAETLVPAEKGIDKQKKASWEGKEAAMARIFNEYGWPLFQMAILIAVVRKNAVDPKDGFIPLAPGSIDIEAGFSMEDIVHKEALVYGQPEDNFPNQELCEKLAEKIPKMIGLTTEYGNPAGIYSLEIVVPMFTKGIWQKVADAEFNRPAGVLLVTPHLTLYCEGMDINNLRSATEELLSVKAIEAIKIAKQLCRECDIK